MGSSLQLLIHSRWEVFCPLQEKMKFLFVFLSATLVYGAAFPGYGHEGHIENQHHEGPHCHDKKEQRCHKIPKHDEHEECYVDYEIILDVTYIEKCEYVKVIYCEEDNQSVHHRSQIVGQESKVVDEYERHGYGYDSYHKRSAEPSDHGSHGGYSSGHKCHEKKEHQCHKDPIVNDKTIPKNICKKIVDTIYIEECEEIIHTVCEESHEQYHHSQHIAGHETKKVAHSEHEHKHYEDHH